MVVGLFRRHADDEKHHVKAEFFAHGIGWVPVNAAGAVGDTAGGDFAFFGNDPGDFIAMANDGDLVLDSFHWGKQNYGVIQGLVYWWLGVGTETRTASRSNGRSRNSRSSGSRILTHWRILRVAPLGDDPIQFGVWISHS